MVVAENRCVRNRRKLEASTHRVEYLPKSAQFPALGPALDAKFPCSSVSYSILQPCLQTKELIVCCHFSQLDLSNLSASSKRKTFHAEIFDWDLVT